MSAGQVTKLKNLLSRVQERRAAPRLTAVPGSVAPAVARKSEPEDAPPSIPEVLRSVPTTEPTAPPAPAVSSAPPNAARGSEAARSAPTVSDLPPLPPLDTLPKSPEVPGEGAGVTEPQAPPVAASAPVAPAVAKAPAPVLEPVVSSPTARIEPQPAAAAESVVRVVAPPRVEAPKTFGELLETSLSLRPR